MLRSAVRIAGLTGALFSGGAFALGLGDMKLYSAVNEPLRAEIKLLKVGDLNTTQVLVKLASLQDFERAKVDREFFLTGMRYEVVLDGRGGGVVRVSTDDPVREPYLNFLLEAKWPSGRLVREYTLLLDLPAFTSTSSAASSSVQAPRSNSGQSVDHYDTDKHQAKEMASEASRSSQPSPSVRSPANTGTVQERQSYAGASDGRYTTQQSDTLWQIANQVRPSNDITVNQTMIALQKENPQAFVNGNINLLKAGEELRIPDEARIRDIANSQARLEVARQMQEWRSSDDEVRQIDARAEARNISPVASDESRGTLKLSNDGGAGINGDVDGSADQDLIGLNSRLSDVMEQLDSASEENDQLSSRVQDLLAEMEDLKNKLKLRNSQLAQLQASGELDSDSTDFDAGSDDFSVPEEQLEHAELDFEQSDDTGNLLDADNYAASTDTNEALEEAAEAERASRPAAAPAAKEKGWLSTVLSPAILGAIGGVLALLVGFFFWKKKRNAPDELEFDAADSNIPDFGEQAEETRTNVVGETGFASTPIVDEDSDHDALADDSASIEAEMGDPIAEADIYVAYGRYPQAVELLNRAIEQEPQRSDLLNKLLEVHTASGDSEAATATLAKLDSQVAAGAGAVGAAIAEPNFETRVEDHSDPAPDVMQEFQATLPDEQAMEFRDEFNPEEEGVDESFIASVLGDDEDGVAVSDVSESDSSLDELEAAFDDTDLASQEFDLGTVDTESGDDGLDFAEEFDLEIDLDEGALSLGEGNAEELAAIGQSANETVADAAETLEEDFVNFESEQDPVGDGNAEEQDALLFDENDLGDDLGIEQGLADIDSSFAGAEGEAESERYELGDLDTLDDLELGLDNDANAGDVELELDIESELHSLDDQLNESPLEEMSSTDLADLSELETELGAEVEETALAENDEQEPIESAASEADETATKLDLARAYVDMGDTDGAKDILDEVMEEGSEADKLQAKELLERIA